MRKVPRKDTGTFEPKRARAIPHPFVLDAITAMSPVPPVARPMFGCLAVYVGRKIVLILRDKGRDKGDGASHDGVWLATAAEHHESLRGEFPYMESIGVFRTPVTSWQILPADSPDFEEAALRACELIAAGDPRIGRVPKRKKARR